MNTSLDLRISGFSTALFSTWYFADQAGVLFDCGDGVSAALMQKSRKVKHVFVSHPDRDHLAGLIQFLQLNGRPELSVYYPKDSGSFPAIADFAAKFDPHSPGTKWIPIDSGDEISIRNDLSVSAFANRHVVTAARQTKSLSYVINRVSRKLKPEFVGRPGNEIADVRAARGEGAISNIQRSKWLIYSGDTPIENDGRYDDAEMLIHEATFLTTAEIDPDNPHRNKHSSLEQVFEMVTASTNIGALVLGHFSNRYDAAQIDEAIREGVSRFGIGIPVYRVLPGKQIESPFLPIAGA